MAHIHGAGSTAARFREDLSDAEVNGLGNLVILCPEHHAQIDSAAERDDFPAELLHRWKGASERGQPQDLPEELIEKIASAHNQKHQSNDSVSIVTGGSIAQTIQILENHAPLQLGLDQRPFSGAPQEPDGSQPDRSSLPRIDSSLTAGIDPRDMEMVLRRAASARRPALI